jgi:hypothetical protein
VVHGPLGAKPRGNEISMRNEGLLEDFRRALPDFAGEAFERSGHDMADQRRFISLDPWR